MSSITYRYILFKATDCIHGLAFFLISVSHANLGLNKARSSSLVSLVYALVVTLRWPFCGCSMVNWHALVMPFLFSPLSPFSLARVVAFTVFSSHSLASPLYTVQVGWPVRLHVATCKYNSHVVLWRWNIGCTAVDDVYSQSKVLYDSFIIICCSQRGSP